MSVARVTHPDSPQFDFWAFVADYSEGSDDPVGDALHYLATSYPERFLELYKRNESGAFHPDFPPFAEVLEGVLSSDCKDAFAGLCDRGDVALTDALGLRMVKEGLYSCLEAYCDRREPTNAMYAVAEQYLPHEDRNFSCSCERCHMFGYCRDVLDIYRANRPRLLLKGALALALCLRRMDEKVVAPEVLELVFKEFVAV